MSPFDIPAPPTPPAGGVGTAAPFDYQQWDIFLRWHSIRQAHEIEVSRAAEEAQRTLVNEALATANAAFAASNNNLADAMRAAAAMQLDAAKEPVRRAPPSEADVLREFFAAGLASGEDGGTLTSEVLAAAKSYHAQVAKLG